MELFPSLAIMRKVCRFNATQGCFSGAAGEEFSMSGEIRHSHGFYRFLFRRVSPLAAWLHHRCGRKHRRRLKFRLLCLTQAWNSRPEHGRLNSSTGEDMHDFDGTVVRGCCKVRPSAKDVNGVKASHYIFCIRFIEGSPIFSLRCVPKKLIMLHRFISPRSI